MGAGRNGQFRPRVRGMLVSGIEVGGRFVEVSNADKVLFPGERITKGKVIEYYHRIADRMLPLVDRRPLALRRFPDGIDQEGFFQKQAPEYFPGWIDTATLEREGGGSVDHVVASAAATLVYAADQGVIEIHTLLAPADRPRRPDQLILDLDPPDDATVVPGTRAIRSVLEGLGVTGFVKSSGSRGVHVLLGLDGSAGFDESRHVARRLAERIAREDPDALTAEVSKGARGGRIFVDWLRNAYAQHAVAPFSLRARPGAPVAVPLDWGEATSSTFAPREFTIGNLFRRLAHKEDPWAGIGRHVYSAAAIGERLERLAG